MTNNLLDVSLQSPVHQVLLTKSGRIDRKPVEYIDKLRANLSGPYYLWDNDSIVELLTSKFDKNVLKAYESIKPLAYKADLARYCIIYTFGGWYSDLTVTIKNLSVLANFSGSYEAILFRDIPMARRLASVSNTIFWFKNPGSDILSNLISGSVDKIINKDYSYHQHSITGPLAFGEEVAKYQLNNNRQNILFGDTVLIDSEPSHVFNEISLKNYQVFSSRRSLNLDVSSVMPSGYESNSDYWFMYTNKNIY